MTFEPRCPGAPAGGTPPSGRIVIVAGADRDPAAAQGAGAVRRTESDPAARRPAVGRAPRRRRRSRTTTCCCATPSSRPGTDPQFVIRTGDLPTSKPLRAWLAGLDRPPRSRSIPTAPGRTPTASSGCGSGRPYRALLGDQALDRRWRVARLLARRRRRLAGAIERTLGDELSEPLVARSLGEWLPGRRRCSSPPRCRSATSRSSSPAREDAPRVLSNRGANGIDGTVSSAFGAAAGSSSGGPVVLLIGDVALAHDIGGLLAASRLGLSLTIVLLNNDGGGIFHFLAVAGETDAFEEHVATPHGLDFARRPRSTAASTAGRTRSPAFATRSRRRSPATPPRSSRCGPIATRTSRSTVAWRRPRWRQSRAVDQAGRGGCIT